MKTYRATLKKGVKGVYGISLVDQPAMEGDFVQFSKEEQVKFADVDKSKNRVMGLILEPNKVIPRDGYNVVLTEQDVKDVAYNFQKQGYQNNSTLQHDGILIDDVTFVEMWLVEDPKMDKSVSFGFNYPKGSWMGVMEIENEVVLAKVRSGEFRGFSIDALLSFEEVKLNKEDMSDKSNVFLSKLDGIKKDFLAFVGDGDKPETPEEKKKREEAEKAKLAKDKEASDKVALEAETVELKKVEDAKDEAVKLAVEEVEKTIPEKIELAVKEAKEPLETKNLELTKEIEELTAKNLELSKKPATLPVGKDGKDTDVKYEDMSKVEKMRYNRGK